MDDEIPDEVRLPIEDAIDLHAFALRDVKDVVASYLEAAREAVRALLQSDPRIASFADAPPDRGGWGATIVVLIPALI